MNNNSTEETHNSTDHTHDSEAKELEPESTSVQLDKKNHLNLVEQKHITTRSSKGLKNPSKDGKLTMVPHKRLPRKRRNMT